MSGKPQELFSLSAYLGAAASGNYDLAADGRFLVMKAPSTGDAESRQRFVVVSNWIDEVAAHGK